MRPGGRLAVSDIALKQPLPPEVANDLMAYIGCIAGAISVADYRSGLAEAGFGGVEVIDTGADLNAYTKVFDQAGCCSTSPVQAAGGLPVVDAAGCCGSHVTAPDADDEQFHQRLTGTLAKFNVNDYAASVRVFALKP